MPFRGPLSITVPGAVRSWGDAHARFGRLSRDAVLAPAIELARDGFPASDEFVGDVEAMAPLVAREATGVGFDTVFRPHGRAWRPGERVRLPALAATLETLARDGFDAFYDGDIGERQARALAAAGSPDHRRRSARAHSTWGDPIGIDYRGVRATSHPPNSSGVVALEILGILAQFEPPPPAALRAGRRRPTPAGSTSGSRRPSSRWPTATRYLTDPDARDVPVADLLDPARARRRSPPGSIRRAPPTPSPATNPPGGGTIYLRPSMARATRSA